MKITLANASKKFNKDFLFKGLDYNFEHKGIYAILGSNGAGKTTLLQILSGFISLSNGSIQYFSDDGKEISVENVFEKILLCSPQIDLPKELNPKEIYQLVSTFKQPLLSIDNFLGEIKLTNKQDIPIHQFSSGMMQRLKLGLVFFFNSEVILLDEPTNHLDVTFIEWYRQQISKLTHNRLIIVASNELREYENIPNQLLLR